MFCFLAKNSDFSKFYPKKSEGDSFSPHFSMSEARVAFTPARMHLLHEFKITQGLLDVECITRLLFKHFIIMNHDCQ